jgi:AcrR family transcriptional regulator
MSTTRERILREARSLLERGAGEPPNMSAIAAAAGISRQALYLHFPDRAALLLALVDYVDDREQLGVGVGAVYSAPDGPGKLRAFLQMQAWRNPRIASTARALDASRRGDPASEQAWRNRRDRRLRAARMIAGTLREEGNIDPSWPAEDAATLIWELTSFRVWDDLVSDAGLAPERYVALMHTTVLAALAAPVQAPAPAGQPATPTRHDTPQG